MGEYADDIIDDAIGSWFNDNTFRKPRSRNGPDDYQARTKPTQWRDANGAVHEIRHMTTTHLMACLALCERHNHHKRRFFEQELKKRVEEAQRYVIINPALPEELYR